MKKYILTLLIAITGLGLITSTVLADGNEDETIIDEKWGKPVFAFGSAVTGEEIIELAEDLGYNTEELEGIEVTGQDMVDLLGDGNPESNMYSSALIVRKDKGYGINVTIDKPELITSITEDQYTNAMITAGVEDAEVFIVTPKKVTGESALTGIYKVYAEKGEELDQDRMEVAQMELTTTADIAKELEEEEKSSLDDALIEIKQQLAELKDGQITEENIRGIVNQVLDERGLNDLISQEDIERLVTLAEKYSKTKAIDSEAVKNQLQDLSNSVGEKLGDLKDFVEEHGVLEKIGNFFKKLFEAFVGLFESTGSENNG